MKKRDEIDEIEDIELDDEIIDDEIIDDEVIEDEDEIEDEKPSKKSKKAKQPKKKGKSKAGLIIGIVAGVLVLALVGGVLGVGFGILGWGKDLTAKTAEEAFTAVFGNEAPTGITAKKDIDATMTAGEMCLAAVENYYDADFVANVCRVGGVVTDLGFGAVEQGVQSLSYRDGKGDAVNSDNANGAKYFAYSKSFGIANMCEEYYSTGDTVTYRKTDKVKKDTKTTADGKEYTIATADGWTFLTDYNDIEEFIDDTSTNFTKIWSYKVDETTILNYDEEVTEKDGVYYFTIKLDKELATEDYSKVMGHQLEENMKMKLNKLTFTNLELEFAVYANGFIKYIYVHESYKMDLTEVPVIGSLSMEVSNNCMNEYTFDKDAVIPYITADLQEVPFVFDDVATF